MAKRFAGFALFSGLTALFVACGGTALTEGDSSRAGGAGFTSGGAGPGPGGAPSGAGSNTAGTSAAGGSSAAGGPSAGGSSGEPCSAPMTQGQCDGYQPSFWHDPKSGLCEPFIYGGCGGNANRYRTRDACLMACPGGGSAWGACQVDSDCTLTSVGCCAACEPVGDHDLLSLNGSHLAEQMATRPCANVGACAPCPSVSEFVATAKYFRAVCVAGQCSALDVRQAAYTECSDGAGCSLRNGVNCCPECDAEGYVAVSSRASFCPNGPEPCGKCTPVPPASGIIAACDGKRCMLEVLLK
jgi:hypothetical protein